MSKSIEQMRELEALRLKILRLYRAGELPRAIAQQLKISAPRVMQNIAILRRAGQIVPVVEDKQFLGWITERFAEGMSRKKIAGEIGCCVEIVETIVADMEIARQEAAEAPPKPDFVMPRPAFSRHEESTIASLTNGGRMSRELAIANLRVHQDRPRRSHASNWA